MGESLERPPLPARHRLDVDACYEMAEAGIPKREDRVEPIDGKIIDLDAIGSPHAGITSRLDRLCGHAAADGSALVPALVPAVSVDVEALFV